MNCLAYIISSIAGISALWLALDIMVLYGLAYAFSQRIRDFVSNHPGSIAANLQVNASTSITIIALIMAGVTLLAGATKDQPLDTFVERGFEWLAFATLFTLAQFLLTRQVSRWTSYLAAAATDSLWWCLAWSLWLIYQAFLPNKTLILILMSLAPIGVLLLSALSLGSMHTSRMAAERR